MVSLAVSSDTIHQRDRQTDRQTYGRTDGHRITAKTALCIASCGKKYQEEKHGDKNVKLPYNSDTRMAVTK